jgi:pimeloyl-ACP methyl ester carboxylesterase
VKQFFGLPGFLAAMAPADQAWIRSLRARAPELEARYPRDFKDYEDGFEFGAEKVLADQMETDLPKTANRLDTAFFVIQGRDDVMTPTKAAIDHLECVKAPKRELILIPDAGHFAFMTSADAFLAALVDKVRPVAIARGA